MRGSPDKLDIQWGQAPLRLRANVERSAAEAAAAAPILKAAWILRGRGLTANAEVLSGNVYDAEENAFAERREGRVVLTARGAAAALPLKLTPR